MDAALSQPTPSSSPSGARSGAAVVRRLTETAKHAIEPFQGSEALTAGKVNLIGLDAIVEALGGRWQGRREQIYDHVERVLSRSLGPNGYFVRVSETDYMIAQPDLGPFACQASCLRALSEVLKHFLGVVSVDAMSVCKVTGLDHGEIVAVPVDPRTANDGERREIAAAQAAAEAASKAEADRSLLSPERWSPFVAANGRKVRVSCKLEPVFELKGNNRIGYRLARRVICVDTDEALSQTDVWNLSRADLLKIDMATIARGLTRLDSEADSGKTLSLIIPVSYITLSNFRGRQMLASAFSKARERVLAGVICEVCDIEDVPQAPLLAAVSMIRPWSVFTMGHLYDDTPRATPMMRDAGLQAISMSCPPLVDGDAEFLGWAKDAMRAANRVSKTVMIYGCSPRRMAMASLMGATHVSVG
jgi:hypothetical protein